MRSARDFLTTKLYFTREEAAKVLGNLTFVQLNEIPSLDSVTTKFLSLLRVFVEELPLDAMIAEIIRVLKAGNDSYQLKVWHVVKLFNTPKFLEGVEGGRYIARKFASETLGTRQCAETENEKIFHFNYLIDKVFPGAYAINLNREEIESSVRALQTLIEIMNAIMKENNLGAEIIFNNIIKLLSDRQYDANFISEKYIDTLIKLNLNSEVVSTLLSQTIASQLDNPQINVNLTAKLEELTQMRTARSQQCNKLNYCDYKKSGYIPLLRLNNYFNPDAKQAKQAELLERHITETIERHAQYCYHTQYAAIPAYHAQKTLGFFKTQGLLQPIFQNLSRYFNTCDFDDAKPFLYFFLPNAVKSITSSPLLIAAEAHADNITNKNSYDNSTPLDNSNGYEYLILLYIALMLVLLLNLKKFSNDDANNHRFEEVSSEDDLESDDNRELRLSLRI